MRRVGFPSEVLNMQATVFVLAAWTLTVVLVLMFLAGAQRASGAGEPEFTGSRKRSGGRLPQSHMNA